MIKQEKIIEVRDRASIVEVISDYVTLKRAGRNYVGLCPFHGEKTPSFTVSEEKGIFHCFGCQLGGSVFDFLMRYDHLSFPEAVERVARRYGITIERSERSGFAEDAREALYRLNDRASAHYHRLLLSRAGEAARAYLKSRGIDEATARRFMLGFAPPQGAGLLDLIRRENLSVKHAVQLGLLGQRPARRFYEKFFARVMFPIVNAGGKTVGFGGRVIDRGMPKYLNSTETPLFHKGSTVYGLYHAREGIRKRDRVVVVEGYLDAIALHQYGIDDAVATLGTALTVNHLRALSRYTRNVIALFDGDEAGRKAAARSFEIFTEAGLFGRAAFLPKGEDPDTFVRRAGKEAVEALLAGAIPLADYTFTWLQERYGTSLEGKSRIASELGRVLAKVQNPIEMDLLARRAADALGIREELLRRPAAGRARASNLSAAGAPAMAAQERGDIAERFLLSLMLRFPAVADAVAGESEARQWFGSKWRPVVDAVLAQWQKSRHIDLLTVAQGFPPERTSQITALALEGEKVLEEDGEKMARDCLLHLRKKYLRGLERNLRTAIRTAEEQRDEKAIRERILEWQDIVRKERLLGHRRAAPKTTPR